MAQIIDQSLRPENILPKLQSSPYGVQFYRYYTETTSTNDRAKEYARAGFPEIGVIVAERQTAGRGRMGRQWISELGGGLWVSILLRPRLDPSQMGVLNLAFGLAVYRALKSLYNLEGLSVKWPNDILISNGKLAGILTETGSSQSRVNWAVVGIGLNVLRTPGSWEKVATPPAFLADETKERIVRGRILLQILAEFSAFYYSETFVDAVLTEYMQCCGTIGSNVVCSSQHGSVSGLAVGVDTRGHLLVRDSISGRIVSLDAKEVSLQKPLPNDE